MVIFRIAQRRGFSVNLVRLLAHVGRAQHVEPFGIRSHDPVLDTVVYHLDEMTGAVRSAVQVAPLRGALDLLAARSALDGADARSEG